MYHLIYIPVETFEEILDIAALKFHSTSQSGNGTFR